MMHWFAIAMRNIVKNRRRSLVTIFAIAVGFAAIGLFRGYIANTYEGLRQSAIRGEGLGHLSIYKAGWLEHGQTNPQPYMLSADEIERVTADLYLEDEVLLVTPQLHISGLISNGNATTIFMAKGVVPEHYRTILGAMEALRPITGESLLDDEEWRILVAKGLAKSLNLHPNSDAVALASTLDGQMNALDVVVSGNYDTGSDATNDKYAVFHIDYARKLYDTEKADQIVILLDDWKKTWEMKSRVEQRLQSEKAGFVVKSWDELSLFYSKVKSMFDMIFLFLFTIVFIIVVMSVVNTMSMSVLERTREIGTLRALGLKCKGVLLLFGIEGCLLGFFGSMLGIVLNLGGWLLIMSIKPQYTPPGSSTPVPLIVSIVFSALATLTAFMIILALVSAIYPAVQASRKNIVDALGHA